MHSSLSCACFSVSFNLLKKYFAYNITTQTYDSFGDGVAVAPSMAIVGAFGESCPKPLCGSFLTGFMYAYCPFLVIVIVYYHHYHLRNKGHFLY